MVMKQSLYIAAALLLAASSVDAQDTYLNDRMTNTSDVFGTARYMGMGGAMGALGGDISVISNNPAGIGLFRRGNISFTLGPVIQDNASQFDDSRATFLFDQMGFVANISNDDDGNRLNFAFNYQKKADYNQYFYGVQNLKRLSQADMFAWIANGIEANLGGFTNPMYNGMEIEDLFHNAGTYYKTNQRGVEGNYYRRTWGSLRGFDLNISGSIEDRYFLGLTFGVDHVKYNGSGSYEEISEDPKASYIMYQDQEVRGYGFNFKVGGIVRPFEDNPFRIGLAIETPTWYLLKHDSWAYLSFVDNATGKYNPAFNLNDYYDYYDHNQNNFSNYLKYLVYSPWKFRLSMGSTVEDFLAWDVEYEYSLNQYTKMGYPDNEYSWYDDDENIVSMDKDRPMNDLTTDIMRGVHNIRAGLELRPLDGLAMRFGYNFYSKPYEDYARLDQTVNSYAMDYNTNTEYLNLGATNILTCGLGYQGKHFYAECAYKYRMQKGDLYLFDDNFTTNNRSFINDNHDLKEVHLDPTEVNLDRHQITLTLGYRF